MPLEIVSINGLTCSSYTRLNASPKRFTACSIVSNTGAIASKAPCNELDNFGAFSVTICSKPLNKSPASLLPISTTFELKLKNVDTIALPIRTAPVEVMTS